MRPIFCGNFEFDASQSDLERLFKRYGKVDRVQMKSGFAFVYMDDERDAEDAIRALDRTEFGRKGRRLSVEWTKHERSAKKPVSSSRRPVNLRPSKTLFVINFPYHTRTRDLEKHFDPFGKIVNVRIRRNFAFVQFECVEDATKALDATNMSKMMERVISVEYAAREDAEGRNGHSPDKRGRGRSPGRGRPPSHSSRERGSPDYGHGRSPLAHRRERASPDYGRERDRSPGHKGRSSPDYGRERSRSPHRASPDYGREHNYSPLGRGRRSANNGHERSRSPHGGVRGGTNHGRSPSPPQRQSVSPIYREHERSSHEKRHERSSQEKRIRNGYRRRGNSSPYQKEKASPDHDRPHSPNGITDRRDSPVGCHESPVDDRRGSLSPLPRDGSRS